MPVLVPIESIILGIPELSGPLIPSTSPDGGGAYMVNVTDFLGQYFVFSLVDYTTCNDGGNSGGGGITQLPPNSDPPFPPVWPYTFDSSLLYGRDHLGQNITWVRGDTFIFTCTITQNGSPVNITGGTLKLTAKWDVTDTEGNAVFKCDSNTPDGIVLTSPTLGVATITISSAKTSSLPSHNVNLFYDIQYTDSSGNVSTVMLGKALIKVDVTTG